MASEQQRVGGGQVAGQVARLTGAASAAGTAQLGQECPRLGGDHRFGLGERHCVLLQLRRG